MPDSESRANQRSQEAQKVAVKAQQQALEERDHSRRQSAGLALDKGIALAEKGEAARGLHWMLEGLKGAPAESAEIQRMIRINLSAWSEQVHGLRHIIRVPVRPERGRRLPLRFSPDGRVIAVASADRLEYRDARTLEPTGKPLVFESLPQAFAFSPDGKTLITGHDRGGAQRWDVTTGSRVGAPLPHGGIVWGVAFSPDGTVIADRVCRRHRANLGFEHGPATGCSFRNRADRLQCGIWPGRQVDLDRDRFRWP